jgi:hypothetical protein
LLGYSMHDCALNQISILAHSSLMPDRTGTVLYVDADRQPRILSPQLQEQADQHLDFLWNFLRQQTKLP